MSITLEQAIASYESMTVYCSACHHSKSVALQKLIDGFGPDMRVHFLPFRCSECGTFGEYTVTMDNDPYNWRK